MGELEILYDETMSLFVHINGVLYSGTDGTLDQKFKLPSCFPLVYLSDDNKFSLEICLMKFFQHYHLFGSLKIIFLYLFRLLITNL